MALKFLYIDDEKKETAEGIIKNLFHEQLEFEIERPKTWNEQKNDLIENKRLDSFDGLLLDLKLEFSEGDQNIVKFNGADFAQTIRSDIKSGKVKDLPIFLCSTDNNYLSFFDRTSYDLFDKIFYKNKDFGIEKTKFEFISFAEAYKKLNKEKTIENIMRKSIDVNKDLFSLNLELNEFRTPHEYINLINKQIIQSNGLLLDETLLAIRLGIDINRSEDWQNIKENLNEFKYNGILGDFFERWWQNDILVWWKKEIGKSLEVMSANEKVSTLIQLTGLDKISPLTIPDHHRFDTFWYKCRLSDFPLDPSDGLRTIEMPRYVWQEPNYISIAYIKSESRERGAITSLLGIDELKLFEKL